MCGGAIAACRWLGLIAVSPAKSRSGSGSATVGACSGASLSVGVDLTVCGVVVDELPDPS